jgi:hypothetical protein
MNIPIVDITLSHHIIDMVRRYRKDIDAEKYRVVDNGTFPLNTERLHSIMDGITGKQNIPPVKLKRTVWGYEVIDGRHRIATALIQGTPVITSSFYWT